VNPQLSRIPELVICSSQITHGSVVANNWLLIEGASVYRIPPSGRVDRVLLTAKVRDYDTCSKYTAAVGVPALLVRPVKPMIRVSPICVSGNDKL